MLKQVGCRRREQQQQPRNGGLCTDSSMPCMRRSSSISATATSQRTASSRRKSPPILGAVGFFAHQRAAWQQPPGCLHGRLSVLCSRVRDVLCVCRCGAGHCVRVCAHARSPEGKQTLAWDALQMAQKVCAVAHVVGLGSNCCCCAVQLPKETTPATVPADVVAAAAEVLKGSSLVELDEAGKKIRRKGVSACRCCKQGLLHHWVCLLDPIYSI